MTIKEIETQLLEYKKSKTTYNHRENALKELDKVREKFSLEEISHITFIVDNYPKYDHFLINLYSNEFFVRLGFNHEHIQSLTQKEIRQLAKAIYTNYLSRR